VPKHDAASSRAEQRRKTEARILAAASRLFVERGYERTTIRAIAGAAGVELSGSAEQVTEQILARLAESLASEPVHSLALLRSMLTHPEAAQALREGAARFQAQISRPIPADDADVRAALVSAVMLGVIVSRHLLNSDALTAASPQQVIDLLRPCLRSLTRADPAPEG
jgi:AcrR family transcriptional regulator